MLKKRYLDTLVTADLKEKMVFIGGPRQVGKTTFATNTGISQYANYAYLNWDSRENRQSLLASRFDASAELLIFDKIHKYKQWKTMSKEYTTPIKSVFTF